MAFTQAQITSLENAIASGVLIVEFSDGVSKTKTQYQSTDAMRAALAMMRKEVAANNAIANNLQQPVKVARLYRSANNGL